MKVVYDTCLYIDFLRSEKHAELVCDRSHIRYMSPIVLMELVQGAKTDRQARMLDRFLAPYSRAERIIDLRAADYFEAGQILGRLGHAGFDVQLLSHDVLIAISAKGIGATLFTSNVKHFKPIARYLDSKIEFVG